MTHTFKKHERLCNHHIIKALFTQGKHIKAAPLKLLYLPLPSGYQTQALVSVSKRYFKKAVHRNRLKRLLREAYRLQKHTLPTQPLALGLLYQSKQMANYPTIYQALENILTQLNQNFNLQENDRHI